MRKLMVEAGRACEDQGILGWRQYQFNLRELKKLFRRTQKLRYLNAENGEQGPEKNQKNDAIYQAFLDRSRFYVNKGKQALQSLRELGCVVSALQLDRWIAHAERQMDQIERRVLRREVIPHSEKVFSIFEPHTEWISKGKAGVPVELGVRVCVLEDQYQFILHHQVMWKETDDKVAVSMVEQARKRYPDLKQCSFDKGFHSPGNQRELAALLEHVILPKKGRLAAADRDRESSEIFRAARIQHPAIESCINNLEQRGLDRCRSHGRHGVERHVALAVIACNLHRIGLVLQRREKEQLERARRRKLHKLAA